MNLSFSLAGNAALEELAQSPHLARLARLDIDECPLNDRALAALAGGRLTGLRHLSCQGMGKTGCRPGHSWVTDAGVKALAASPAARLLHLDLGNQRVGDAGLGALLDAAHVAGLRELRLWANQVTDEGVRRLLAAPGGADLQTIDLRANPLSAAARQALRRRYGWGVLFGDGPPASNTPDPFGAPGHPHRDDRGEE
jgi:hypothetical protein